MAETKLMPALWFHTPDGKTDQVTHYYKSLFKNDFVAEAVIPLGETPGGNAEMCYVSLFEQSILLMTTAIEHHKFNDSFAYQIFCNDQSEIDLYWNYLTKEGAESKCGWCIDKFGLRWQIIPKNMGELMNRSNAGSVLAGQTKIIIDQF
ncbi:MAG: VOC family protein [Sphingobacteriales bacterium]|jgi:predicted 3-demethylubiquinone-9 3-methyltransferase (glyoxalase superfamily)|nr:VOC family protein [Sphingobacteriales bacterium]